MLSVEDLGMREKKNKLCHRVVMLAGSSQTGPGVISNNLDIGMTKFQFLTPNFDAVKFTRTDVAH